MDRFMRKKIHFFAFLMLTSPCSAVLGQQLSVEDGKIMKPVTSVTEPCPQYKSAPLINEYTICLTAEAEKGSASAANILIDVYNGFFSSPPDQAKATYYASMSARQDDPIGMRALAARNAIGLGTAKNWDEALRLRRRQAQLFGSLPPLHISGGFSGYGSFDAGVTTVAVQVNSDGTKKSCSAKGSTEKNQKFACKVIMKYFGFLPAVSSEGLEVAGEFSNNITLKPYVKPAKIDDNIPAKLARGEITRQDFVSENINIENSSLVLNLELSNTGAIMACKSASVNPRFSSAICQIAKRKLVFLPSKNVRGQGVSSKYDFAVDLGSNSLGDNAPSQSARPKLIDQKSDNIAASDDKILQSAIKRCELIGFEKGTSDYKVCVTDQIKILSGIR
jgi:hypothetical protein